MKEKKDNSHIKWVIESFVITFILSGVISYISANGVSSLNVFWAVIILILVIILGIFFDIVGVAVTVADESHFNAKATKKVRGAKSSLKLIKNSSKVANICADVIGDICGVLSGAISTMIAMKVINNYGLSPNVQFLISALVASLTVGGKALGKDIATKESTIIVHLAGIILNKFYK
ncbi:MAG: hypothetical protein HFJ17_02700 [Clostridia bacterium]|nr:hypothetical protein [Clostridia bacterium]